MDPYRELEHTADIGLEIYGNSIEELFINSVKGLFHVISPRLKVAVFQKPHNPAVIELKASTQEDLLVLWLNEFIYNFFVKGVFPKVINIISLTENDIKAGIEFEKYNRDLGINLEIKAATYHEISIKKIKSRYDVRVIFDV